LNPSKVADSKLKRFDSQSDIDLIVISEVHFEAAWRDLRTATQPTLQEIDPFLLDNLNYQKKKLFDGAIVATMFLPYLSFGLEWIPAMVRVEEHISIALDRETEVHAWLYRDYWSVRNYISGSIVGCRGKVE
jgi:hypothetical protein